MRRSLKPRSRLLRHAGLLLGFVALVSGVGVLVWQLVWLRALATADQTASVAATVLAIVVAGFALLRWWRAPAAEARAGFAPAKWVPIPVMAEPEELATDLRALGADKSTSAIALGVHSAIPLGSEPGEDLDAALPTFVPRDQGAEVAAWLRSAATTGGVLVLVGDSSVGKTRLLYETALAELPDFRVAAPDPGDRQLADRLAWPAWQRPGLIVWLDEMHRFLSGPYSSTGTGVMTATLLRRLLDLPTPVVVLGSLWPEHLRTLMSTEIESETGTSRLRYPDAASILGHGRCRKLVLTGFSAEERTRAEELANHDPRLGEALSDRNFNVTEALAGAPRLIERFDHAAEHERAILLAAVDARRLGILAPLSEHLLRAAAGGHYTGAHPSDTEIHRLLHELTSLDRPLDRAAAPLLPVHEPRDRTIVGYTVADYLLQSVARRRRRLPVPDAAWESYLAHTTDPADVARLADSADRRGLYRYAIPLYRRAMAGGLGRVAPRLATLLAAQGSTAEAMSVLKTTKASEQPASFRQAAVKARQGDNTGAMTALRGGLMSGDTTAAVVAADINDSLELAAVGDIDELRRNAEAGDRIAAWTVADLLRDEGRPDEAIAVLQPYADAGDAISARRLAELGGSAELDTLRAQAESGDHQAGVMLAARLHAAGRPAEAIAVLRGHADAGDLTSARRLARLLAQQTNLDDLRSRADAGDHTAAWTLADLLHAGGETDKAMAVLRIHANDDDHVAAATLAELMHASGHTDRAIRMLRRHTDDPVAAGTLADLHYANGDTSKAIAVLRSHTGLGDLWAADRMDELLDRSNDSIRRSFTDARDRLAAWTLAGRLHASGETRAAISELRGDGGVPYSVAESTLTGLLDTAARINNDGVPPKRDDEDVAAWTLADRLHIAGRADEAVAVLRPRAEAGDRLAAWTLADLLYATGKTGEAVAVLRSRADLGDMTAARRLAEILAQERDVDSLRARADAGDQACAMRLASILAKRKDLDGLREELFAGNTGHAAVAMHTLLQARAKAEPDQPWFGFNTDGTPASAPA